MDDEAVNHLQQFPWESTPAFLPDPGSLVSPGGNVLVITAPPKRIQEAARDYVERIRPDLPESVRDSFAEGAGMFDFPAPPDLDGHLS